jgi:predicted PurR-regulated permease PerM
MKTIQMVVRFPNLIPIGIALAALPFMVISLTTDDNRTEVIAKLIILVLTLLLIADSVILRWHGKNKIADGGI